MPRRTGEGDPQAGLKALMRTDPNEACSITSQTNLKHELLAFDTDCQRHGYAVLPIFLAPGMDVFLLDAHGKITMGSPARTADDPRMRLPVEVDTHRVYVLGPTWTSLLRTLLN